MNIGKLVMTAGSSWWTCRDLNSGPLPCQGSALQAAPHAQWTYSGAHLEDVRGSGSVTGPEGTEIPEGLLER